MIPDPLIALLTPLLRLRILFAAPIHHQITILVSPFWAFKLQMFMGRTDVLLGYSLLDLYLDNPACFVPIGPSANRADKADSNLMVLSIIFLKTTVQTTKITCILIWLLVSISAFGRQKLKLKIR